MRRAVLFPAFGVAVLVSLLGVRLQDQYARRQAIEQLSVRLPVPVQLMTGFGDRFLAANINVIRSILLSTDTTDPLSFKVQGQLQSDAALFNAFHVDNYYLAAAALPWHGELTPAMSVLSAATKARQEDELPPFYLGFLYQAFLSDYYNAGKYADLASSRSSGLNQMALKAISVKWYEKSDDLNVAIATLKSMQQASRDPALKQYIQLRVDRVSVLMALRHAANDFESRNHRLPRSLDDLIGYGGLSEIPKDPTGIGFYLNQQGIPTMLVRREQR